MMQRRGRHYRNRCISERRRCGERRRLETLARERFGQRLDVGVSYESETITSGMPPGEAMTTPIEQIAVEYSGWGHRYEDYHRRSMNLA